MLVQHSKAGRAVPCRQVLVPAAMTEVQKHVMPLQGCCERPWRHWLPSRALLRQCRLANIFGAYVVESSRQAAININCKLVAQLLLVYERQDTPAIHANRTAQSAVATGAKQCCVM